MSDPSAASRENFKAARQFLLDSREDYSRAYRDFEWPKLDYFNWAFDWFDDYAAVNPQQAALCLVRDTDPPVTRTFLELSEKSSRVASFLHKLGIQKGDRILVMLPNVVPLWECLLGAMKLGAVIVPTSVQVSVADLMDRSSRGQVKLAITDEANAAKFDTLPKDLKRVILGSHAGWVSYSEADGEPLFVPQSPTRADDLLFLYFTSGTTARPKLVAHTHRSYPVGHLSTMYWIGIQPNDIHQNISSPGWAKHAWSSFFAPWNAGATVFVRETPKFQPSAVLQWLSQAKVNSLCAPPTVWRMFILENLGPRPEALRELVSAGEPLNEEVIQKVQQAWGITIRDGFGQTETTAQIGNSPEQRIKPGSMGRPLPGYKITLIDGEIAIDLGTKPCGLMTGYIDDPELTRAVTKDGFYRTGDEATQDDEGYIRFVGRGDDVFKSSDYRISPFELESVLLEHPDVAEAAIVPSPDAIRHCVPKAFVSLKPGIDPSRERGRQILEATNLKLAPYKRIRRIEFRELPKTISGKIRRAQLRNLEAEQFNQNKRGATEYWLGET